MQIVIIRHARAEDRAGFAGFGQRDAERRLTEAGRKDMRRAAKGLRKIAPDLDVLAASPLARARETAEIVARVFGGPDPTELAALAPGAGAAALLEFLGAQAPQAAVALVGHEPDLSGFAAVLLAAAERGFIELKKGAACLIAFPGHPEPGTGTLAWALAPGQLRKLAG
jgi:phosphohistidine phosphatase